jgi:F-type H+-transporting ATPase subunit b
MLDLNATLIGQLITFAFFIWFTMKYVWPPITQALEDRKAKIAEGLAAAERGKHDFELAQRKSAEMLREAKTQAATLIDAANKRAGSIIDEAKEQAQKENERLLEMGKSEIEREFEKAKQQIKKQVAIIAMKGAEKILQHNIDAAANRELLDKLITEI